MKVGACVLAVVAISGCDFSRSHGPPGSAVVTGIVQLPAGTNSETCDQIGVKASFPNGDHVGRADVHASHGRCLYEINGLPEDQDLTVEVKSSGWTCQSGAAPAFAPATSLRTRRRGTEAPSVV